MKTDKRTEKVCRVAVEGTTLSFDSLFTYTVPPEFSEKISDGTYVMVPFGRSNKLRSGVVFDADCCENSNDGELKAVAGIQEKIPPLSREMLNVAEFMKERCFCTYYDCVKAIFPVGVQNASQKEQKLIRICESTLENVKITEKQQIVLDFLKNCKVCSPKEICYFTGCGTGVADALVKKGLAEYFYEKVNRIPQSLQPATINPKELELSEEQEQEYCNLSKKCRSGKASVSLLYGVTGSGKTLVYVKLISDTLCDGKSALLLVPEIALTPQLVQKFRAYFGESVAVLHSALSFGERKDELSSIAEGKSTVVIGTRSAVFAPLKNLGIIIIDEEQENSYKSESTPRYHALDIAKFRSVFNDCLLVLGSATPDIKTYYYAETGRYGKCVLKKRFGSAFLPIVTTVDMNLEPPGTGSFSNELLEAVELNLENGKQTILLHNRRGHNTFAVCKSCKQTVTCPNCSISLTYHSANNRLMCHYCGHSARFTSECPSCHAAELRFGGTGTQKAELDLTLLFPSARILRMDADVTVKKNSHQKLLDSFAKGEYDILVGTQMIAKGLDFPNVTLVGVVNADQILYSDDYKSFERGFSLLTQVVGRSGRGDSPGRAIIQTYTPENPVISLAASQDYEAFYNMEASLRKAMLYPPFADICIVGFSSEIQNGGLKAAEYFLKEFKAEASASFSELPLRVLNPSPETVVKVNNKFRYRLMIKCRNSSSFRRLAGNVLKKFYSNKELKNTSIYIDFI